MHDTVYGSLRSRILFAKGLNEPLGAEGPPLVGEEVCKEYVGKVGS